MRQDQFSLPATHALGHATPRAILDKMLGKISTRRSKAERAVARAWCEERCESYPELARRTDAKLWAETEHHAELHRKRSHSTLRNSAITFGGAAAFDLLYFLVRFRKPRTVVETGVAAGWSSAAILGALGANGAGDLYSSDLPYLRQRSARAHIGILVPAEARGRWTLMTDGDRRNLPKIVRQAGEIDLFHYDSDKSRAGRAFATNLVRPHLSPNALLIFDDIQDNLHFAELAAALASPFHVFQRHKKFLGLIGLSGSPFIGAASTTERAGR